MPNYFMQGPTDVDEGRVITYCTDLGAVRVTQRNDGAIQVEIVGLTPFAMSADGADALREAIERFQRAEEGRP